MSARWPTLLLWALVAASAVAWGLKLFVSAPAAPPQVAVVGVAQAPRGDVTRVLGVDAVPAIESDGGPVAAADARFQLVGVLAPRSEQAAREGVALIAVDGKPAKAFRVGAVVDGNTVLQTVRARGADLGPAGGAPTVALNIPPPAAAATGTLPDARSGGAPAPAAPGPGRTIGAVAPATPPTPPAPAPAPGPRGGTAGTGIIPVTPSQVMPAGGAPVAPPPGSGQPTSKSQSR